MSICPKFEVRSSRRQFIGALLVTLSPGLGFEKTSFAGTSFTGCSNCKLVSPPALRIPLGFDNFSIRAMGWKAERLIAFAEEEGLDSLLLSDLDVYENHKTKYLHDLKLRADDGGLKIQAGTGGICPSSSKFIRKWGTAEEHLRLGIRVARDLGSPVFRCYLGGAEDRMAPGGIAKRIDDTVTVLKKVKAFAIDSNVKIAVENHAGDMQARELKGLIEAAGKEFVGATVDSGNATWTLEDPQSNLEILGPYAVSSGIRDSTVWMDKKGARVAWNAIGQGQIDWETYVKTFAALCPGIPFQLEIISGFNREIPFKDDSFWKAYPGAHAADFEKFLRMARTGTAVPAGKPNDREYQMNELRSSIRYCKQVLGMGHKRVD